jgi:hypothetical protein
MKYNTVKKDVGAIRFVFVTRGKAKPFSDEEIKAFFDDVTSPIEKRWAGIPDTKARKVMFMKDLKMGMDFCVGKYAATKEEILAEAQRIAPYFDAGK